MKYFKKIVGERVYLSPVNPEDNEKYVEWLNDLKVSLNLTMAPKIISLNKEKEILENMSKEGYNFAIVDKKEDELLGNCGLMDVELIHGTAELGIFIGEKDYWNKGYGTEVINLILDYGFNILNLNNIMLRVHSFNKRAINCYKKCGFKEIGRRREGFVIGDDKYDDIYMDILAEEFEGSIPDILND